MLAGLARTGIQAQSMFVKEKSGSLTSYSLANIRKLTFTPGTLKIINTAGNADGYLLEEIRFLTFSDIIIGIDHPARVDLKSAFRILSNPVKEFLTISPHPNEVLNGRVDVVGLNGIVIKSIEVSAVNELKIDVRELVDGIYLCRLCDKNGWHTEKFLKAQ